MVKLTINSETIDNIQLVIFDKDGTLIDLYTYWSEMVGLRVNLATAKLGLAQEEKERIIYAMGVDLTNGRLRSTGPVGLQRRELVLAAMVDALAELGFTGTQRVCLEAFEQADQLSLKQFPKIIKPIEGMYQLIDSLHRKGCRLAVATTDKAQRAQLALSFLNLAEKVDLVAGADMVTRSKPAAEMVNLILERLQIDRRHAVMVGDAISDVEMGNNANLAASIGVCSGLTPKDKLLEKTKYIIKDISEIEVL